jgi:putative hydrolase of the HAD superfamily
MSITTIVFDFGNVLGFFSHRQAVEQLGRYSPLTLDEMLMHLIDEQLEDDFESGRISVSEFRAVVRQRCRLKCTDDEFDVAVGDMFTENSNVCELVPLLKPRYRLLLLSNTNELHTVRFRRQFAKTLAHFDALVLSHEVRLRKPNPEIYHHCRKLADCPASQCLFIDDLPSNVEAARACGWQGIVYQRGLDLRREMGKLGIELAASERARLK